MAVKQWFKYITTKRVKIVDVQHQGKTKVSIYFNHSWQSFLFRRLLNMSVMHTARSNRGG